MNKILIITDFRVPKKGDKFLTDGSNGHILYYEEGQYNPFDNRLIVGAEIEVPEYTDHLLIDCRDKNGNFLKCTRVDLPRKTVKKWLWERNSTFGLQTITKTASHWSEDEMKSFCPNTICDWRKVPGSEVEVQE